MEFHEEIEYLIELLQKTDSNNNDIDTLDRLEKLLEEYAKGNQQRKVRRNYF